MIMYISILLMGVVTLYCLKVSENNPSRDSYKLLTLSGMVLIFFIFLAGVS